MKNKEPLIRCPGEWCMIKHGCKRYNQGKNTYPQFLESPVEPAGYECLRFMPNGVKVSFEPVVLSRRLYK